jgi:hypothetical protein
MCPAFDIIVKPCVHNYIIFSSINFCSFVYHVHGERQNLLCQCGIQTLHEHLYIHTESSRQM